MKLKILILSFFCLFGPSLLGQSAAPSLLSTLCTPQLGTLPIQQNGRAKPLLVHAREVIKYLTGQTSPLGRNPVATYCLLSFEQLGLLEPLPLTAPVEHSEVRSFLELADGEKAIPYSELVERTEDIRRQMFLAEEESSHRKALQKLLSQAGLYRNITSGQNWFIPEVTPEQTTWLPLGSFFTKNRIEEAQRQNAGLGNTQSGPANLFASILQTAAQRFEDKHGKLHLLEYRFVKLRLPTVAMLLTLLALAALTLWRHLRVAMALTALTVAVQIAILTIRVIISGRAPITNMYETVLFSGFGALLLAALIGYRKREKTFLYMGLAYNACTLMMMNFATGMLNDGLNPLVPVLRDNFWLSTHVTTIIMSYGALALSWVLANTVLIHKRFWHLSPKDESYYSGLAYTCLKCGTIMLGAGIILGGVWADYSWGRFWGWDPKETWSLIAFCLYMAILHGRYTNWIPPHRFMSWTAAAFLSILMAWFGVNYILAAGLHSYGFSEGGAVFLGSAFAAQIGILLATHTGKRQAIANRQASGA